MHQGSKQHAYKMRYQATWYSSVHQDTRWYEWPGMYREVVNHPKKQERNPKARYDKQHVNQEGCKENIAKLNDSSTQSGSTQNNSEHPKAASKQYTWQVHNILSGLAAVRACTCWSVGKVRYRLLRLLAGAAGVVASAGCGDGDDTGSCSNCCFLKVARSSGQWVRLVSFSQVQCSNP